MVAATGSVRTSLAARIALVFGSVLFTLVVLELGTRLVVRGPKALLTWKNIVLDERRGIVRQNIGSRFTADPMVGYIQRPGFQSALIHYDANGLRVMPPLPPGAIDAPPILATGDSFTQGDEAADDETWPAVLQQRLGWRVVNAGVAAYGLDQTVLRTEQLAAELKPAAIVVGFIADDIKRSEMSRTWGAPKPYFALRSDGDVELRNVPVPAAPDPRDTLGFWERAFGWSVALEIFLELKGWRYEWVIDHERATPRGTGEKLACPLMRRLAGLNIPTLVVAQYDIYVWQDAEFGAEQRRLSRIVLECAEKAGLATLDTYDTIAQAVRERGRGTVYRTWHPSPDGYRLIGDSIAEEMQKRGMLPK
jgi:lysophospholipase L1-like esterase